MYHLEVYELLGGEHNSLLPWAYAAQFQKNVLTFYSVTRGVSFNIPSIPPITTFHFLPHISSRIFSFASSFNLSSRLCTVSSFNVFIWSFTNSACDSNTPTRSFVSYISCFTVLISSLIVMCKLAKQSANSLAVYIVL
jgi:hypothetical protein